MPRQKERECDLCGDPCKPDDWCWGCGEYICEKCGITDISGPHTPEEHLR